MMHYMHVFAWLLLGMGLVLGVLGLLALAGLLAVQIDFFGLDLDTPTERTAWTAAWLLAAAAGIGLLRMSRRRAMLLSGTGA